MADKPVNPAVSIAITAAAKGQVAAAKLNSEAAGQSGREAARTQTEAVAALAQSEKIIKNELGR